MNRLPAANTRPVKAEAVLKNVQALRDEEEDRIGRLQKATSAAELRAIFGGHSYAAGEEE